MGGSKHTQSVAGAHVVASTWQPAAVVFVHLTALSTRSSSLRSSFDHTLPPRSMRWPASQAPGGRAGNPNAPKVRGPSVTSLGRR